MKALIRKIRSVKKRKLIKNLVGTWAAGMSLRYGQMSHKTEPSPFFVTYNQFNQQLERPHPYQQSMIVNDDNQSSTENQSVEKIRAVKLGSGIKLISKKGNKQQNQISEPLKSALEVRSGDLGKGSSPGARARSRAKANANQSRSSILPGASAFGTPGTPQHTYCTYHKNTLHCKPKVTTDIFPGDDGNGNNPPPEDGSQFDFSQYKGGPSPFKEFDYDNENHTRENVDFSNQRRMNHSYDGHAKKCFGMQEPRNKQSLQKFEKNVRDYIESPETERINGSYRYETPAYHYKKPGEDLLVTVNATTNEYISVRNATDFQLENLEIDGNLGYDSRPSMELRLRGPK